MSWQMVVFAREPFFFCFKADCLPAKETSDNILSTKFLGYPCARRRVLKLEKDSCKFF